MPFHPFLKFIGYPFWPFYMLFFQKETHWMFTPPLISSSIPGSNNTQNIKTNKQKIEKNQHNSSSSTKISSRLMACIRSLLG